MSGGVPHEDVDDDVKDGQGKDRDVGDVLRVLPEDGLVRKHSLVNQTESEKAHAYQFND